MGCSVPVSASLWTIVRVTHGACATVHSAEPAARRLFSNQPAFSPLPSQGPTVPRVCNHMRPFWPRCRSLTRRPPATPASRPRPALQRGRRAGRRARKWANRQQSRGAQSSEDVRRVRVREWDG